MTKGRNGMVAVALGFLTGCLVGGAAGVLYAPQSGARTRRQIGNLTEDMQERAGEMVEDARGAMTSMVDQGRSLVNSL